LAGQADNQLFLNVNTKIARLLTGEFRYSVVLMYAIKPPRQPGANA
jgi:hypothetical protein